MNQNIWSLIGFAAVALIVVGGLAFLSQHYTLDNIKSKTVGDGQYGTARWATKREIQKTYRHVPFQPELWRKGEHLPRQQGLVLGSLGRKNHVTALVDCDDIHCLMIGASGVGKTAFFLYPNLEYACASGMSYLALDTKGDLARNYGAVASKYYCLQTGSHCTILFDIIFLQNLSSFRRGSDNQHGSVFRGVLFIEASICVQVFNMKFMVISQANHMFDLSL